MINSNGSFTSRMIYWQNKINTYLILFIKMGNAMVLTDIEMFLSCIFFTDSEDED